MEAESDQRRSGSRFRAETVHLDLPGGLSVCLRTIHPGDEMRMREGIARMSPRSRYLRFFSGAEVQPDSVIESLIDVDGTTHIAWGAIDTGAQGHPAVGAVHAVQSGDGEETGTMEFSVAVIDAYQGRGLARLLTAALLVNCLALEIPRLEAYILAENVESQEFMRSLGGTLSGTDGNVFCYRFDTADALARLLRSGDRETVNEVVNQLGQHLPERWRHLGPEDGPAGLNSPSGS